MADSKSFSVMRTCIYLFMVLIFLESAWFHLQVLSNMDQIFGSGGTSVGETLSSFVYSNPSLPDDSKLMSNNNQTLSYYYFVTPNGLNWMDRQKVLTSAETKGHSRLFQHKWPSKPPRDLFPDLDKCEVVFRQSQMHLCHVAPFGGNFGDLLGPDIVERLLEYHFGCSAANNLPRIDFTQTKGHPENSNCLWSVGSVWRWVRGLDHVWGTGSHTKALDFYGCNKEWNKKKPGNITVYSTRGPATIDAILHYCVHGTKNKKDIAVGVSTSEEARAHSFLLNENSDLIPRGDPGFLLPFLFPEYTYQKESATLDVCLILHFYDETNGGTKKIPSFLPEEQRLPVIQHWKTMVQNMTRCKHIVSSSLHGLVLSDAFGIPSRWYIKSLNSWPYKFFDYFHSFNNSEDQGIHHWNDSWTEISEALTSKSKPWPEPISYLERSDYARAILETFPFHLFETRRKT